MVKPSNGLFHSPLSCGINSRPVNISSHTHVCPWAFLTSSEIYPINFSSCCPMVRSCYARSASGYSLSYRFAPNYWGGGGYLKVHSSVGSLIDWVSKFSLVLECSTQHKLSPQYNVQVRSQNISNPLPYFAPDYTISTISSSTIVSSHDRLILNRAFLTYHLCIERGLK